MSGRYRTIALQAVGVAVLAAFVFIAFLRPSDPGDLAGIDAPGGGDEQTVVPSPADGKEKGKNDGSDQNGPGGNDRSDGPGAIGIAGGGGRGSGSGLVDPADDGTVPSGDDAVPATTSTTTS